MDIRKGAVCRECLALLRQPKRVRITFATTNPSHSPALSPAVPPIPHCRPVSPQWHRRQYSQSAPRTGVASNARSPDLNSIHQRVYELSASILKHDSGELPSEQRNLYVLEQFESIVKAILDERRPESVPKPKPNANRGEQESATSALLGSVNTRRHPAFVSKESILSLVSEKAEEIVRHPHVFITPAILKAYTDVQALLQQPASFPDVFALYANKPVPRPNGNVVDFKHASPNKINAAIDPKTANAALTAAIQSHNLPLAIDVITTSFSTPAFKKAKVLRQAAFPISGLAVAPVAAYTLSGAFSSLQQTMDQGTATGIAFAGIMTYVGAVSMVGYVAVTTANDQMDRVTWASGVPLWERWIREEERAAIDRVASAWGFKDVGKRGEEEGEDWESLREWAGVRGMVLDRVSLMEGME